MTDQWLGKASVTIAGKGVHKWFEVIHGPFHAGLDWRRFPGGLILMGVSGISTEVELLLAPDYPIYSSFEALEAIRVSLTLLPEADLLCEASFGIYIDNMERGRIG